MAITWNGPTSISSNPFAWSGSMNDIPGLSEGINQIRNQALADIEKAMRLSTSGLETVRNTVAQQAQQAEQITSSRDKQAIESMNQYLQTVAAPTDNFLGSQIGALSSAGLDSSVVAAYAAAGAKSGVDNYQSTLAQANAALRLQQQFLDRAMATPQQGRNTTETLANLMATDLGGEYGTAISQKVGDLVSQLTDIQNQRQQLTSQTNALIAGQSLQNTTNTAKALMGLNSAAEGNPGATQSADVAVGDVSQKKTTTNAAGAALDSRGGGRYVTTSAGRGSGLQI